MDGRINIALRVDVSLQIGSGHFMRCLMLADTLKLKWIKCHVLCREHPGNLIERIRGKGHPIHVLTREPEGSIGRDGSE